MCKNTPVLAAYKSGTGTRGRRHRETCVGTWDLRLRDARRGTWGHQVWDAGTCGTGTRGRQKQGRRGRGMWMIIAKVGGKCDIGHFNFLVNMFWWRQPTLPSLGFLHACLRSEDSAKTPCIEESETVVLFFLLMEYWKPKQGRVGCGRQNVCRITGFVIPNK